uniref:homeobox-leucine zipper protein HDG11-like n=1 Tax=Erigeron canadensis TaxID=72917 RepID=UPI001CB8F696|nr:homeobox-leucine zipper protein HDG11-like [Erigeron canadensis]
MKLTSQCNPLSRPVATRFLRTDGCIDHFRVSAFAVYELSALALDKDGLFWTNDGLLNQQHYQKTFPLPPDYLADSSTWTHASRASAIVKMEHTRLATMFTVDKDWEKLFPSIVSKSTGLRFLSPASSSLDPDGSIQLIQIQLQATTPIVPERTFVLLRTCKRIDEWTWVVADVSVDSWLNIGYPCGCLIHGIPGGLSQVTWVEHLEFEESYLDPKLYNDLCSRGFAFGAERWVACLERSCERRSYRRTKSGFVFGLPFVGKDLMEYEKKCVMRFSKRMVRYFCSNIAPPVRQSQQSSCIPAPCQSRVYLKLQHSPYHDDP